MSQVRTSVNPHASRSGSLPALVRGLYRDRHLISQMVRRDVVGRYKGSVLGLLWSFLNPLLMLLIYTFVFAVVFQSRWSEASGAGHSDVAIMLFTGIIVHTVFSDVLNRAPSLIIDNVNYVKRVVFPLEILPVVAMGSALFHAVVSIGVLLAAFLILNGFIHLTTIALPLVLLPLVVFTLGLAWFVASLGVFLRDVGQTMSILTTATLFLSAVFYPVAALPVDYQSWFRANPLAFIIEQSREVVAYGQWPDWSGLGFCLAGSIVVMIAGYCWFQKTRKGFADVL